VNGHSFGDPVRLAALALVACTPFVASATARPPQAQTAPAQPQRPAFTTSVDVVSVDVNVIDGSGHPVRDLSSSDFTLMVDGKVRRITSAQFVPVAAVAPIGGSARSEPAPSDYSTNVGAPTGRLIAIVIDRGSIAPLRAKHVLAATTRFVERLGPADRVGLFSIPSGPAVDFTTDHASIMAALQRTDGQAEAHPGTKNIGIADALGFERGSGITIDNVNDRECGVSSNGRGTTGMGDQALCVKLVREEAGIVATYAHERARNTIAGLRNILDRLGSSDTPKTIVLVSESLVIDGERNATAGLARAIAAAHATIYTLKPEASDSDASEARAPLGAARDRAVQEEGLISVARIGGGEMFRIIADPDFAFTRLESELSGYYLLGFEPEQSDRDGGNHAISVKVARKDVAVRSRVEFTIGATRQTDEQIVMALLRAPVLATSVPLRLTTYAFQDPESPKIRLLVGMEVERPVDPGGHLALGIVLVKPGGEIGAALFQPSIMSATQAAQSQKSFATLLVDPGVYTLRAAIVDSHGRRGSLERPIRAYMTRISRFRATELLVGDEDGGDPAAGGVAPTISGNLSGGLLHVYMELFADSPVGFDGTSVSIEVVPAEGSAVVDSAPAVLQLVAGDDRCRAAAGAVPISRLPKGNYLARAVISLDGRKVGQMTRPFRVVKP